MRLKVNEYIRYQNVLIPILVIINLGFLLSGHLNVLLKRISFTCILIVVCWSFILLINGGDDLVDFVQQLVYLFVQVLLFYFEILKYINHFLYFLTGLLWLCWLAIHKNSVYFCEIIHYIILYYLLFTIWLFWLNQLFNIIFNFVKQLYRI